MATTEVATVVSTKKLESILVEPVISKPVPDHLTGTSKQMMNDRGRNRFVMVERLGRVQCQMYFCERT